MAIMDFINKFYFSLPLLLIILTLLFIKGNAQSSVKADNIIDTTSFRDSAHHWYDIDDTDKLIFPGQNRLKYRANEINNIAANILLYQKANGGWPKNYDMQAVLSADEQKILLSAKYDSSTTFDNGTTHAQIEYLAEAYQMTGNKEYKDAAQRGLKFILKAQYENGGWPQYYPDTSGYKKFITFNDGAMTGIMKILADIYSGNKKYAFLDLCTKNKLIAAYKKGIECILKCQIKENGSLLLWCQQHDNITLLPREARKFEPAAICNGESCDVINLLMDIKNPSEEIVKSVDAAVAYLKCSAIKGIRVKRITASKAAYRLYSTDEDRIIQEDPSAPDIWTRYCELKTHKPLFCNRDGVKVYKLSDVDRERRVGYAWYVYCPAEIIAKYKIWKNTLPEKFKIGE
jgi:PelA/Pel-15E family pectate lyase